MRSIKLKLVTSINLNTKAFYYSAILECTHSTVPPNDLCEQKQFLDQSLKDLANKSKTDEKKTIYLSAEVSNTTVLIEDAETSKQKL